MRLLQLSWKNIISDPLQLLLNLLLFAMGIGLIHFLVLFNDQLKDKFDNNLAEIDMVLGAKGSPLQLILCNMYHVDNPTGNIKISEAKPFLNPKHPLIETAIPLSTGDSYKGFRIIGTEHKILGLYKSKIRKGRLWTKNLEAVIGSNVQAKLGLKLGDTFFSSHGFVEDENFKHEHGEFKVVGILGQNGTVLDQLILCNSSTVWEVHDHDHESEASEKSNSSNDVDPAHNDDHHDHNHNHNHDHDHDNHDHDHSSHDHDHDHHDHSHHDHNHDHGSEAKEKIDIDERAILLENLDKEITAILVKFKNRKSFQALSMPRNINSNTDLMAASPAYEINKLFDLIGVGTKALRMLAILIALVSFISIFISLLSALRKRKYELALMRVLGSGPISLFVLIILEGILLAFMGYLLGILISYFGSLTMAERMSEAYQYNFKPMLNHPFTFKLLGWSLFIGFAAAFIPALIAYRTNIHKTLSNYNQ